MLKIYEEEALQFECDVIKAIGPFIEEGEYYQHEPTLGGWRPDFIFIKGCKALEWPANTVVEILYSKRSDMAYTVSKRFEEYREKFKLGRLIIIWKNADVPYLRRQDGLADMYSELGFQNFLSEHQKPEKNIDEKDALKEEPLDMLGLANGAFHEGRNTFFLGAGVSMDAKLAGWNCLLENILKPIKNEPFKHINEANSDAIYSACGDSNLIMGRYIAGKNKDAQTFLGERIREVLYKDKEESHLVNAICEAIAGGEVDQVITYNYDDLIESKLVSLNAKFSPVSTKSVLLKRGEVPIFHVHGMIPENNDFGKIKPCPVLSEKDYHTLYRDSHNWSNVTQLFALNNTTCFFIGFSMSDPNLRRLLDIARSDDGGSKTEWNRPPHFVFLRKVKLKGEAAKEVNEEHWAEQEYMMRELGLNVIWFNEFKELPDLIRRITK